LQPAKSFLPRELARRPAPPAVEVVPLTPEEKCYAQGQEVCNNLCVACHQPDAWAAKIAPSLSAPLRRADAGIPTRSFRARKAPSA
jgi:cytochrome c2